MTLFFKLCLNVLLAAGSKLFYKYIFCNNSISFNFKNNVKIYWNYTWREINFILSKLVLIPASSADHTQLKQFWAHPARVHELHLDLVGESTTAPELPGSFSAYLPALVNDPYVNSFIHIWVGFYIFVASLNILIKIILFVENHGSWFTYETPFSKEVTLSGSRILFYHAVGYYTAAGALICAIFVLPVIDVWFDFWTMRIRRNPNVLRYSNKIIGFWSVSYSLTTAVETALFWLMLVSEAHATWKRIASQSYRSDEDRVRNFIRLSFYNRAFWYMTGPLLFMFIAHIFIINTSTTGKNTYHIRDRNTRTDSLYPYDYTFELLQLPRTYDEWVYIRIYKAYLRKKRWRRRLNAHLSRRYRIRHLSNSYSGCVLNVFARTLRYRTKRSVVSLSKDTSLHKDWKVWQLYSPDRLWRDFDPILSERRRKRRRYRFRSRTKRRFDQRYANYSQILLRRESKNKPVCKKYFRVLKETPSVVKDNYDENNILRKGYRKRFIDNVVTSSSIRQKSIGKKKSSRRIIYNDYHWRLPVLEEDKISSRFVKKRNIYKATTKEEIHTKNNLSMSHTSVNNKYIKNSNNKTALLVKYKLKQVRGYRNYVPGLHRGYRRLKKYFLSSEKRRRLKKMISRGILPSYDLEFNRAEKWFRKRLRGMRMSRFARTGWRKLFPTLRRFPFLRSDQLFEDFYYIYWKCLSAIGSILPNFIKRKVPFYVRKLIINILVFSKVSLKRLYLFFKKQYFVSIYFLRKSLFYIKNNAITRRLKLFFVRNVIYPFKIRLIRLKLNFKFFFFSSDNPIIKFTRGLYWHIKIRIIPSMIHDFKSYIIRPLTHDFKYYIIRPSIREFKSFINYKKQDILKQLNSNIYYKYYIRYVKLVFEIGVNIKRYKRGYIQKRYWTENKWKRRAYTKFKKVRRKSRANSIIQRRFDRVVDKLGWFKKLLPRRLLRAFYAASVFAWRDFLRSAIRYKIRMEKARKQWQAKRKYDSNPKVINKKRRLKEKKKKLEKLIKKWDSEDRQRRRFKEDPEYRRRKIAAMERKRRQESGRRDDEPRGSAGDF